MTELCGDAKLGARDRLAYLWRNLAACFRPARRLPRVAFTPALCGSDPSSPGRALTDYFLAHALPGLLPPGDVDVLEIGCGSGRLCATLEGLGYRGSYVGVDVADRFDATATGPMQRRFIRGDAHDVAPEGPHDLVVSISALEHIPDDSALAARMDGWLKPGGWQVHLVPAPWGLFTYLWHGYRQYGTAALRARFDCARVRVFALGGLFSFLVHLLLVTVPEILLRVPLRRRLPRAYAWVRNAASRLDRWAPVCPTMLAVCQPRVAVTRVCYMFKDGRRQRLGGDGPGEFFYGYRELARAQPGVAMIENGDLGLHRSPSLAWRWAAAAGQVVLRVHPWVVHAVLAHRWRIDQYDVVVATTASHGLALALLKRLGLLRTEVVFLAMGLTLPAESRWRLAYLRWLLAPVRVFTISEGEHAILAERFGRVVRLSYVPFGVDHRFWTPGAVAPSDMPYVLAIGNDPQRDWATLAAAWRPGLPRLRIVTRLPVPRGSGEIEVIQGDWNRMHLDDSEVRDLYRGALFVVLPLRLTLQPSGQSACLQAMACGKAVVLTETPGLWDRALMVDGRNCLLVPPGDIAALYAAADRLAADRALRDRLGTAGRATVEDHLNLDRMAEAMGVALARGEPR